MQHQAAQLRTKARGFPLPVAQQADRGDDQRRLAQAAGVFFDLDVGQCLQGLAQAHVVGQDTAQAVGAQKLQPVQALLLVGAQLGLQAGRHWYRWQLDVAAKRLSQLLQGLCTCPHRPFAQADGSTQRIQTREFEAVARKIMAALAHQFQQRL